MPLVDDASNLLDDVIVKLDEIICSNLRWHCWELSWKWDDIDDDDFDNDDDDDHLLGHDPSSTSDKVLPGMGHHTPGFEGWPGFVIIIFILFFWWIHGFDNFVI